MKDRNAEVYPRDPGCYAAGVDTSEYVSPARGPKAELESMCSQHSGVFAPTPPSSEARNFAIDEACKRYPRSRNPMTCLRSVHYWEHNVCPHVNLDAGPGWPLGQRGATNAIIMADPVLRNLAVNLAIIRIERLMRISPQGLKAQLDEDPLWAVKHNLADVHREFIKDEPHPLRKLTKRSWRIINMLSLVDNLVDRFLFSVQDTVELENWETIPSKCGSGLTDQDGLELAIYVAANRLNLETDVTGWDVRVPDYLLYMDIEVRARLNNACQEWYNAATNVTTLAARKVMMTSDGVLYVRNVPGGQSSGRKITSSGNSRMRFLLHALVSHSLGSDYVGAMTQGDDCVEYLPVDIPIGDYKEAMAAHGVNIKLALRCSAQDFGFCSQRFTENGMKIQPDNVAKMVSRFVYSTKVESMREALTSLKHNTRHMDDRRVVERCEAILEERLGAALQ